VSELTTITRSQARTLTDRIKVAMEGTWLLIQEAYTSRAWAALDYASWDEYCTREFGTARLQLPREERREVVASLRESGLSVRAIASATRIDKNTVLSDLHVSEIQTPEPEITGTDGKVYPLTRPAAAAAPAAAPSRPRTDIPRTINSALIQIDGARRALEHLTRTQITHQTEEARRAWTANLSESLEALTGFLCTLSPEGETNA